MKQIFRIVFIFCLLLTATVFAQTEEARMIDEFGAGVPCDEYLARADAMGIAAANNPNARIYIYIYEGRLRTPIYKNGEVTGYNSPLPQYGLAKAKIESMKKYFKLRKFYFENYVFVNAGFRENFWVEIWLVPPGAEPPKPTPTLKKMKYRKGRARGFCIDCC